MLQFHQDHLVASVSPRHRDQLVVCGQLPQQYNQRAVVGVHPGGGGGTLLLQSHHLPHCCPRHRPGIHTVLLYTSKFFFFKTKSG